jgi:hypothetical protein
MTRLVWVLFVAAVIALGWFVLAVDRADAAAVNSPSISSDGMLYAAVEAADEWWAEQGQRPCKGPVLDYDEGEDPRVIARGDLPGCAVYFERRYVRTQRARLRRAYSLTYSRLILQHACMVAIHERGHNLGLGHEPRGVMSVKISHPTLGHCIAWSHKKMPAGT